MVENLDFACLVNEHESPLHLDEEIFLKRVLDHLQALTAMTLDEATKALVINQTLNRV